MSHLEYYEKIIQVKRQNTSFREFIRDFGSWLVLNVYKNHGKISRYPDTNRVKKLGNDFWEVAPTLGIPYTKGSLFSSIQRLHDTIPLQPLFQIGNSSENCDFADVVLSSKNVYLGFTVMGNAENVAYSAFCYPDISNTYNSFLASHHSGNIYMSSGISHSQDIFYSRYITDSSQLWFCTNMIGCLECIGCDNLKNQKYCIGNVAWDREKYFEKKQEILKDKGGFSRFHAHICTKKPIPLASENVTGNAIHKSSHIENGGWITGMHTGRNVWIGEGGETGTSDVYDGIDIGRGNSHIYASVGVGMKSSHVYCSSQITACTKIYYSYFLDNCSFCIGCIGLQNKSYCILNTQYTKEEWEEKACEIFAAMERDGTLGSFFPASMNPFYFNDTMAYLIDDSFTKEEVEKEGYMWRDESIKVDIPEGLEVVKSSELGRFQGWISHSELDSESSTSSQNQKKLLKQVQDDEHTVWYIDPDILRKVIQDEHGNIYRIVPMEYDFLMKHALPLPEIHWLERMKMGMRFQ